MKDPLNPSRIIYSRSNRQSVSESEIIVIIDSLLKYVDTTWYNNLKTEVDQARSTDTIAHRATDGVSIFYRLSEQL